MNDKYKISVIIPVYNGEKYIKRCLDSVMEQTIDSIEMICVNDGSTDNSARILEEYSKYENVKIITQENQGPSAARNNGIRNAEGKYIAFVDCDDYIEKEMYKEMYEVSEKYNLYMIMCNYVNDYSDKKSIAADFGLPKNTIIDKKDIEAKIYPCLMQDGIYNGSCNKIYLRTFINECTASMPDNIKYGEDLIFQLELFDKVEKTYFIDKTFYHYVHRENSLSTVNKNQFEKTLLFMYNIRSVYAQKWGIEQSIVDYYFVYYSIMDFINSKNISFGIRIKKYLGNQELSKALKNLDFRKKYTLKLYMVFIVFKLICR